MKKAIRHFNRGLVIGLEAVGLAVVVVFLAWMGLLWRLSLGPLNVDFLTDRVESALSGQQQAFVFDVGRTEMVWGGRFTPFELQMSDVQISRADRTPVLAVDRVGLELSKRHLVFGRVVPRVISIHGPALRVIRWEDGRFSLNLGGEGRAGEAAAQAPAAAEKPDLIRGLLAALQDRRLPFSGGLRRISITDAALFYEGRLLGVTWKARDADIVFERGAEGIVSQARVTLDLDETHTAELGVSATYDWDTQETTVVTAFRGLTPALAAQGGKLLEDFAEVRLPLKGSVALRLDADFRAEEARFILGSDPGTFNWPGLYAAPIPVRGIYAEGHVDLKTWEGGADSLKIDLGGPVAEAQVALRPGTEGRGVSVKARLRDMPIDDLKTFWPHFLATDARDWVTGHLSAGTAQKATLEASALRGEDGGIVLESLGGRIDFTGIDVDYFPPLLPVRGVDGHAVYDAGSFTLDLSGGRLGDMAVGKSDIRITGLGRPGAAGPSRIDISAALSGPLRTALEVLDGKPLGYPRELGLSPAAAGGSTDVDVSFAFPLHKALRLDEVKVRARATLRDVALAGAAAGLPLTGGPMELDLTDGALGLKGAGKLGGMPVTFDWKRDFRDGAGRIAARLTLDGPAMRAFGAPEMLDAGGALPSDIVYETKKDGTALLTLKGDLADTVFSLPVVGFRKEAGVAGSIDMSLRLRNGNPESLNGLVLRTGQSVLQGDMHFGSRGLEKAAFGQAVFGDTDVSATVERGTDGGYTVRVKGRQVDLSSFMEKGGKKETPVAPVPPVFLFLDVGRVVTGKDRAVEQAKIYLHRNAWQRLEQMEMDGTAGGKAVYLRYMPEKGGHSLRFEADNAGAALRVLGISSAVRGGRLALKAVPKPKSGPRDMAGNILLADFTLVKAPVLARLLNAMSLPGIMELLNGKGIAFKKARANFVWTDRSPPADGKQVRLITVRDGQTSGASLGLTFEGKVDDWSSYFDLNGTIVPVSDLNKLLNNIPIIGNVLTAGGEGVFAATYTVKGPIDQPTVTVNPLAALAPGVLRKLFFEN